MTNASPAGRGYPSILRSSSTVEHVDVDGDRAVIRWRITGAQDYRGVNLMRVRDGKIVEALGYGKRP